MARLRRAALLLVFTALAVLLGPTAPACACSCALGTLDEYTSDADAIFIGTVREIEPPWYPPWSQVRSSGDLMTAHIKVTEVYKGAGVSTWTSVVTEVSGASCGFEFAEGHRYLVFAREHEGSLRTSLCAGNRDLAVEGNPFSIAGQEPIPGGRGPGGWTAEKAAVIGATAGVAILAVGWWLLARRRRRTADQKSA